MLFIYFLDAAVSLPTHSDESPAPSVSTGLTDGIVNQSET